MNQSELIKLVDDLGYHFDDLNFSAQDLYEKLAKLVGTKQYKIYSDQFPDVDLDIEKEVTK